MTNQELQNKIETLENSLIGMIEAFRMLTDTIGITNNSIVNIQKQINSEAINECNTKAIART